MVGESESRSGYESDFLFYGTSVTESNNIRYPENAQQIALTLGKGGQGVYWNYERNGYKLFISDETARNDNYETIDFRKVMESDAGRTPRLSFPKLTEPLKRRYDVDQVFLYAHKEMIESELSSIWVLTPRDIHDLIQSASQTDKSSKSILTSPDFS